MYRWSLKIVFVSKQLQQRFAMRSLSVADPFACHRTFLVSSFRALCPKNDDVIYPKFSCASLCSTARRCQRFGGWNWAWSTGQPHNGHHVQVIVWFQVINNWKNNRTNVIHPFVLRHSGENSLKWFAKFCIAMQRLLYQKGRAAWGRPISRGFIGGGWWLVFFSPWVLRFAVCCSGTSPEEVTWP